MNCNEVVDALQERFPEYKKNIFLKRIHGKNRIYIYQSPNVMSYIELRVYKDTITLATPKVFYKSNKYLTRYQQQQKTRKYFYKTKMMVDYINRDLICRNKMKKLEKMPKFKEWQKDTAVGFI